jgi:hypothetical protein
MENGGVLLAMMEMGNADVNMLCDAIFPGLGATGGRISAPGALFEIVDVDDMIVNGAFGDLRPKGGISKHHGEDASDPSWVNNIPLDSVTVYSHSIDALGTNTTATPIVWGSNRQGSVNAGANLWKHNRLNLFFLGDGGLTSTPTTAGDLDSHTITPFYLNPFTYFPEPKNPYYTVALYRGVGYGRNWTITGSTYPHKRPVYNSVLFANVVTWAMIMAAENQFKE